MSSAFCWRSSPSVSSESFEATMTEGLFCCGNPFWLGTNLVFGLTSMLVLAANFILFA